MLANDPKRISKYNAFYSNMSYNKLKKKNILLSNSLSYRRPENKIYVGGDKIKTIKMDGQTRAKSTLR